MVDGETTRQAVISLDHGSMLITFPSRMTLADVDDIKQHFAILLRMLARVATRTATEKCRNDQANRQSDS